MNTVLSYSADDPTILALYEVGSISVHWRLETVAPVIAGVDLRLRAPGTLPAAARESLRLWAARKFGVSKNLIRLCTWGGEPG